MRPVTVLVVEDDRECVALIRTSLEREAMLVSSASTAQSMWAKLADLTLDLIVLDIGLPDEDGYAILRKLRHDKRSTVPVIILTGRNTTIDKVLALDMGADDFIAKPFDPRELVARIRTVLRRAGTGVRHGDKAQLFRFCGWTLDEAFRRLIAPDGQERLLTSGEFELLRVLVENANMPLSRDTLLEMTRARSWSPFDRSVDVLVARLRKKLETNPRQPRLIRTIRTVGYMLVAPVEVETAETPLSAAV